MKKFLKPFLTLTLVIALVFTMSVPAFAGTSFSAKKRPVYLAFGDSIGAGQTNFDYHYWNVKSYTDLDEFGAPEILDGLKDSPLQYDAKYDAYNNQMISLHKFTPEKNIRNSRIYTVPFSYTYRVAKELDADPDESYNETFSGLRVRDACKILGTSDKYNYNRKDTEKIYKLFNDVNKADCQAAVKKADIITVELGENDLTYTFIGEDAFSDNASGLIDVAGLDLGDMKSILAILTDDDTEHKDYSDASVIEKLQGISENAIGLFNTLVVENQYYFTNMMKYIQKNKKNDAVVVVATLISPFNGLGSQTVESYIKSSTKSSIKSEAYTQALKEYLVDEGIVTKEDLASLEKENKLEECIKKYVKENLIEYLVSKKNADKEHLEGLKDDEFAEYVNEVITEEDVIYSGTGEENFLMKLNGFRKSAESYADSVINTKEMSDSFHLKAESLVEQLNPLIEAFNVYVDGMNALIKAEAPIYEYYVADVSNVSLWPASTDAKNLKDEKVGEITYICHPNNEGQQQIANAILEQIKLAKVVDVVGDVAKVAVAGAVTKAVVTKVVDNVKKVASEKDAAVESEKTPVTEPTEVKEENPIITETVEVQKLTDEDVVAGLSDATLRCTTSKTSKGIKITAKVENADLDALKEEGYTVAYKFYRSSKKSSGYKYMLTSTTGKYTNTSVKKGNKYYYKTVLVVTDSEGNEVTKSVLKDCKYGARTF